MSGRRRAERGPMWECSTALDFGHALLFQPRTLLDVILDHFLATLCVRYNRWTNKTPLSSAAGKPFNSTLSAFCAHNAVRAGLPIHKKIGTAVKGGILLREALRLPAGRRALPSTLTCGKLDMKTVPACSGPPYLNLRHITCRCSRRRRYCAFDSKTTADLLPRERGRGMDEV